MNKRSFGGSLNANVMAAMLDTSASVLSDFSAPDFEYIINSDDEMHEPSSNSDNNTENENNSPNLGSEGFHLLVSGEDSDTSIKSLFCSRFCITEDIEPIILVPISRNSAEL